MTLKYAYLGPKTFFLVLTDAAFKKEVSTGHALKGTVFLRLAQAPKTDQVEGAV